MEKPVVSKDESAVQHTEASDTGRADAGSSLVNNSTICNHDQQQAPLVLLPNGLPQCFAEEKKLRANEGRGRRKSCRATTKSGIRSETEENLPNDVTDAVVVNNNMTVGESRACIVVDVAAIHRHLLAEINVLPHITAESGRSRIADAVVSDRDVCNGETNNAETPAESSWVLVLAPPAQPPPPPPSGYLLFSHYLRRLLMGMGRRLPRDSDGPTGNVSLALSVDGLLSRLEPSPLHAAMYTLTVPSLLSGSCEDQDKAEMTDDDDTARSEYEMWWSEFICRVVRMDTTTDSLLSEGSDSSSVSKKSKGIVREVTGARGRSVEGVLSSGTEGGTTQTRDQIRQAVPASAADYYDLLLSPALFCSGAVSIFPSLPAVLTAVAMARRITVRLLSKDGEGRVVREVLLGASCEEPSGTLPLPSSRRVSLSLPQQAAVLSRLWQDLQSVSLVTTTDGQALSFDARYGCSTNAAPMHGFSASSHTRGITTPTTNVAGHWNHLSQCYKHYYLTHLSQYHLASKSTKSCQHRTSHVVSENAVNSTSGQHRIGRHQQNTTPSHSDDVAAPNDHCLNNCPQAKKREHRADGIAIGSLLAAEHAAEGWLSGDNSDLRACSWPHPDPDGSKLRKEWRCEWDSSTEEECSADDTSAPYGKARRRAHAVPRLVSKPLLTDSLGIAMKEKNNPKRHRSSSKAPASEEDYNTEHVNYDEPLLNDSGSRATTGVSRLRSTLVTAGTLLGAQSFCSDENDNDH